MRHHNPLLLLATLFFATTVQASEVRISESYLKSLIDKNPPSVQQIEASFLAIQQEQLMKQDALAFRLEGEGNYYHSKERLLNNFDGGVTSSASSYSLGLVKPTRYGVEVGVKAFGEKATNAFVSDAAANGATLSLSVDLWQDFLGRRTNNDLKRSRLSVERAELEKVSSLETFEANIRKLYWSLVANNERKKLISGLVNSAYKQYQEALQKNKAGVADIGQVARFRSVYTSRKADLWRLEYQESELLKSLRELLPELNGKDVKLAKYNVPRTVKLVIACADKIAKINEAPFEYTNYDEIVDLLEKEEKLEQKTVGGYNGPQVKLVGEVSTVGRGFGYDESYDDLFGNGKPRSSVGVQFSMPLGGSKTKTKKATKLLQKNRYLSQAKGNLSKINAYHHETASLAQVLKGVIANQNATNVALAQSLKTSKTKYQQARIGLQELISEQDALLQSRLNEIDSNLAIIHTLIDYLGIYNDMPCAINKM